MVSSLQRLQTGGQSVNNRAYAVNESGVNERTAEGIPVKRLLRRLTAGGKKRRGRNMAYAAGCSLALLTLLNLSPPASAQRRPPVDQYRTIDGTNNNPAHPSWGSAGIQLLRVVDSSYEDGISSPSQASGPNCRTLSNILCQQNGAIVNWKRATDFLWQWGQFLDHDIDLTESNTSEPFFITVPSGDPWFDPLDTGTLQMPFFRSMSDIFTGTDPSNPRQQLNGITAFIDACNVYGSDPQRAAALRTNDGTGRLKVSDGDFLPYNIDGLPNGHYRGYKRSVNPGIANVFSTAAYRLGHSMLNESLLRLNAAGEPDSWGHLRLADAFFAPERPTPPPGNGPEFFLAGDVRANEQVALTAMHTLFVREHNRLADQIRAQNGKAPYLSREEIYDWARAFVGAEMQVITYREFSAGTAGSPCATPLPRI